MVPDSILLSLSSNQIPGRLTHGPSLIGIRGVRFAFVMRRKPQDSIAWGERARACAVGAFHQLDAALQKTFCLDRDLARKSAFECFHRFHLISYQIASYSTLNPCFAACAHGSFGECTHIRGPIRRLIERRSARKRGQISKQSLESLLHLWFFLAPLCVLQTALLSPYEPADPAATHVFRAPRWLKWFLPACTGRPPFLPTNQRALRCTPGSTLRTNASATAGRPHRHRVVRLMVTLGAYCLLVCTINGE